VKPKLPLIANLLRLKNDVRKLCHVVNDSLTLRHPLGLDLGHKSKPTRCRTPLRLILPSVIGAVVYFSVFGCSIVST
jgi:hypothetical protein